MILDSFFLTLLYQAAAMLPGRPSYRHSHRDHDTDLHFDHGATNYSHNVPNADSVRVHNLEIRVMPDTF